MGGEAAILLVVIVTVTAAAVTGLNAAGVGALFNAHQGGFPSQAFWLCVHNSAAVRHGRRENGVRDGGSEGERGEGVGGCRGLDVG